MNKLILICFTCILQIGLSQTNFTGQIGGADGEVPYGMISDHDGNILVCGVFDQTVDFDLTVAIYELTSTADYNGFIAKYDSAGALLWVNQFDAFIYGIEVNALNEIYATGIFDGVADVDPSPDVFTLTSGGLSDGLMLKLNSNGDFLSAIQIGGSGEDGVGSFKLNSDGDIYVSGGFSDTVDFDPSADVYEITPSNMGTFYFCNTGFIAKYNSEFNLLWAEKIAYGGLLTLHKGDPGNEYILISTAGVSATSNDSSDFDPSISNFVNPVPDSLPDAHWMGHIKYDADGNYIWSHFYRTFGSLGSPSLGIYDVELDDDQNIYFTGSYILSFAEYPENDISLEPFIPFTGASDGYLIKTDSTANLLWQKRFGSDYGSDYGSDFVLDNLNNIHLTGAFQQTAEFNEDDISETLMSAGSNDAYIIGYSSEGEFLYKGQAGSAESDGGFRITKRNEDIVVAGIFANTTDCDLFATESELTSLGYQDIFITSFVNEWAPAVIDTTTDTTGTFISEMLNANTVAYPNPFNKSITIQCKEDDQLLEISIFNLLGNQLDLIQLNGSATTTIGSELPNGFYNLKIKSKNGISYLNILKTE